MSKVDKLKKRFENHVLTCVIDTEHLKVFDFRNASGRGIDYQRWIIDRGTLIVTRDNYDAIYSWNDTWVSLQFLATCNLGYFSEKCKADKDGSGQKVFEAEYAQKYLQEIAIDNFFEDAEEELVDEHTDKWKDYSLEKKIEILGEAIMEELGEEVKTFSELFYYENVYEAANCLMEKEYEFLFGIDGWEYANGLECLTVVPQLHLAALRVAHEKYPNAW